MPFFLNGVFLIPTGIILKGLWVKGVGALGGYLIGQVCVASTKPWVSSECTFPCEAPAQAASHQVRQRCCWLIPVKSQRNAATKGRDLSSRHAVIPDHVLQIHFSNLPFLCLPSSPQAQAKVAQLPEFPSAQPQLSVTADQLPVCGTDEPAAEVLSPEADCSPGEVHTFQQAWFQLVRTQRCV